MFNSIFSLQVGGSVFYSKSNNNQTVQQDESDEVENLNKEIKSTKEAALLETQLSSLVWICTSTHAASMVTVIDANNPADILDSFGVCTNHLLCIASVPGASPSDYKDSLSNGDNITETGDIINNVEMNEQESSNNEDASEKLIVSKLINNNYV